MVRRFFSYYRPYTKLFVLDFSCAVIAALLELCFPLVVKWVVDNLLPGKDWERILWACFSLLLMYLAANRRSVRQTPIRASRHMLKKHTDRRGVLLIERNGSSLFCPGKYGTRRAFLV